MGADGCWKMDESSDFFISTSNYLFQLLDFVRPNKEKKKKEKVYSKMNT